MALLSCKQTKFKRRQRRYFDFYVKSQHFNFTSTKSKALQIISFVVSTVNSQQNMKMFHFWIQLTIRNVLILPNFWKMKKNLFKCWINHGLTWSELSRYSLQVFTRLVDGAVQSEVKLPPAILCYMYVVTDIRFHSRSFEVGAGQASRSAGAAACWCSNAKESVNIWQLSRHMEDE